MSPRPRSLGNRDLPPNLYPQHRAGRTYYTWRDPRSGRFHSLGSDKGQAVLDAKGLNSAVAAAMSQRKLTTLLEPPAELTLGAWMTRYERLLDQRLADGDIKPATRRNRVSSLKHLAEYRAVPLADVDTRICAEAVAKVADTGARSMARVVRATLVDLFQEALAAGVAQHNPARDTRKPKAPVTRERLTLEGWQAMRRIAETGPAWVPHLLLLALVTGQRLGDLCAMRHADYEGGVLRVHQEKTGRRIAIPGALRLDAIDMSLDDVVRECQRGRIVGAQTLLHHRVARGQAKRGDPVALRTASHAVTQLRREANMTAVGGPSAHEIRSLAKRLYLAQGGVDTLTLLGHRSLRMGDMYADPRGAEFEMVKLGGAK